MWPWAWASKEADSPVQIAVAYSRSKSGSGHLSGHWKNGVISPEAAFIKSAPQAARKL